MVFFKEEIEKLNSEGSYDVSFSISSLKNSIFSSSSFFILIFSLISSSTS